MQRPLQGKEKSYLSKMKKLIIGFTVFIACGLHAQQKDTIPSPTIHVTSGDLRGITVGDVTSF
jgi:hypothetical protein